MLINNAFRYDAQTTIVLKIFSFFFFHLSIIYSLLTILVKESNLYMGSETNNNQIMDVYAYGIH